MSKKTLFTLWGVLFALCAGLGFLQPAEGVLKIALFLLSLGFFLPPALLLRTGEIQMRRLIRNLSLLSLGLTLGILILSFLTALQSEFLGAFLGGVLTIVSAPMVCSGYWAVSLFLWACLFIASLKK